MAITLQEDGEQVLIVMNIEVMVVYGLIVMKHFLPAKVELDKNLLIISIYYNVLSLTLP